MIVRRPKLVNDVMPGHHFATTRWSLVLAAAAPSPQARRALEELCEQYWHPLYAFLRHHRYDAEEARDLTQAFLLDLLERGALQSADSARGRFRSFLLGCLKNFLAHDSDRRHARKRGGGRLHFSLQTADAELHYQPVSHEPDPATVFDRAWMYTLLSRVLDRMRQSTPASEQPLHERLLKGLYDPGTVDYASLAKELNKSEPALRQSASRLRRKYRDLLHQEIAQTLSDPADTLDEINHLFRIASSR